MDKRQTQSDGDIITALCSLPKIISEDGQDYVQLADVLETVRRYKPSVAIPNKAGHWVDDLIAKILEEVDGGTDDRYIAYGDICDRVTRSIKEYFGSPMEIER